MSFRGGRGNGRGGGGGRGFGRGGGGGFGRGGGRGGFNRQDEGPPDYVEEVGTVSHPCQEELVVKCTHEKVPYFNAPIYLENKQQIGKIDEILGPVNDFFFSVKLSDNMKASSFKKLQRLFIDPKKTLPAEWIMNPNNKGRGGGRGGAGGRGGGRGGNRGSPRGGGGGFRGRGGFSPRGGGGYNSRGGGFTPRGGGGGRGFSPRGGGRGGY